MGGYCGHVLRVNLSTGEIGHEQLDPGLARRFVGGRGLGTYLLTQAIDPGIDPLSPANPVIIATGPLTGSRAPASGRHMVITKSPLSGTVACSNSGGFWGTELKRAGLDLIIVEGKAPQPCYLRITDDQVSLEDATGHWGKLVWEATDDLLDEVGDPKARVLCIGPAGEKLSLIAAIMNDKYRAAGRSGVGAVMGSKNLKAIVVRGTGKVEAADETAAKDAVAQARQKIKAHPVTSEGLPTYGTAVLVNVMNEHGVYPTRNFQRATFETADQVSGEALAERFLVKNVPCAGCPIVCGRLSRLDGVESEGPEYETLWAYSADCGVDDLAAVIKANNWCNQYGLDTISAGATIACAMELVERGAIKPEELDGPPLAFGSGDAVVEWTRKMGACEGFGAKLAQGSQRLADECGMPELSMSVKRLELPAYDPRGVQGQGLQYATSNRGGCHVRGYLIAPEVLGVPEALDRFSLEAKALWAKTFQDLTAVIDSLGLCLFTSFALGADDYRSLFNAVVGEAWSTDELMLAGERIWNLERQFNLRAGIGPEQDTLPRRLLQDPVPDGPSAGHVHRLAELLPEYYAERGWGADGTPTEAKLAELGLS